MTAVLDNANTNNSKNPWNTGQAAYVSPVGTASPTAATLGQVEFGVVGNVLVGAVTVQNPVNNATKVTKRTNIE